MPKRLEEECVGKNVSLKLENLILIKNYQNRTNKGFSQTLNKMLEEWDKYSLEILKLKESEERERVDQRFAEYKKATVEK